MKKSCLEKWLKALESGSYIQGSGALRTEEGFCALGVLCDISALGEWRDDSNSDKKLYFDRINYLPQEVADWAGMTSDESRSLTAFLIVFNDKEKRTFGQLAKIIKEKYKLI